MNKQRREAISSLISDMEAIKERIESLASEEREYYDNMPENMQQGDKGQAADTAASNLEESCNNAESVIDGLNDSLSE